MNYEPSISWMCSNCYNWNAGLRWACAIPEYPDLFWRTFENIREHSWTFPNIRDSLPNMLWYRPNIMCRLRLSLPPVLIPSGSASVYIVKSFSNIVKSFSLVIIPSFYLLILLVILVGETCSVFHYISTLSLSVSSISIRS